MEAIRVTTLLLKFNDCQEVNPIELPSQQKKDRYDVTLICLGVLTYLSNIL